MTEDVTPLFPQSEMARPVPIRSLNNTDSYFPFEASPAECAAIAARLRILEVGWLRGKLTARLSSDQKRIFVAGTVSARVVQACVVTLAPVATDLVEEIDLIFGREPPEKWPDEIDIADADEEWPEILRGDEIDLGEIAIQAISLGLPDYPRAPGAAFDPDKLGGDGRVSPFSVLKDLKKTPE